MTHVLEHHIDLTNFFIGSYYGRLTAKERRGIVRQKYGAWFDDNGFKLGRDYMVVSTSGRSRIDRALLTISDPQKAILFKLTWL